MDFVPPARLATRSSRLAAVEAGESIKGHDKLHAGISSMGSLPWEMPGLDGIFPVLGPQPQTQDLMSGHHHASSEHGSRHHHRSSHRHRPYWKRVHRDWRMWCSVALMLLAIGAYILVSGLALRPRVVTPPAAAGTAGK